MIFNALDESLGGELPQQLLMHMDRRQGWRCEFCRAQIIEPGDSHIPGDVVPLLMQLRTSTSAVPR